MSIGKAITVGLKAISATVKGFYVRSSALVERCIYDTDGYLYQLGTKLTMTAAQLNGTSTPLTTPAISGGVATDMAQTFSLGAHDYGGAHADWTLSAAELLKPCHKPTNADAGVNAIVATTIRPYLFINCTGQAVTVKTAAGTGIAIANGKAAWVMSDGTNVIRLTGDA